MVISDTNATGGLLGRQIGLHHEKSAATDSVEGAKTNISTQMPG
jgi:hypothetical protein